MELELRLRGVPFVAQQPMSLEYKGTPLTSKYIPDLVCYGRIIVELKASANLVEENRAQAQNYLKGTGFRLGWLLNFGHFPKVEFERIVAEQGRYNYGK